MLHKTIKSTTYKQGKGIKMIATKRIRTKNGVQEVHINRRRACRFMCLECTGWEYNETSQCNGKMMDGSICALFPYKDMSSKQNARGRSKAIRNFCLECMCGNVMDIVKCTSMLCPLYPYRNTKTDKTALTFKDLPKKDVESPSRGVESPSKGL